MFKIEYKNGTYQGQMVDDKRTGLGIYIWDNGNAYFGEWFNNEFEGEGFLQIPKLGVIQAQFKRNKLHGSSYFVGRNVSRFATYQFGRLEGRSVSITGNQEVQLGLHAKGQLVDTIATPDVSDVEVVMDNILSAISSIDEIVERNQLGAGGQSFGYLEFPNRQMYLGCISNRQPEGLGLMNGLFRKFTKDACGDNEAQDIKAGNFEAGLLVGLCSHHKANGDVFIGQMERNQMQGGGIYWIEEQRKWYLGNFVENRCERILKTSEGPPEEFQIDALKFGLLAHQNSTSSEKVRFPYSSNCDEFELRQTRQSFSDKDTSNLSYSDLSSMNAQSVRSPAQSLPLSQTIEIKSPPVKPKIQNNYGNIFSRQKSKENASQKSSKNFTKSTCSSQSRQRSKQQVVRPCQRSDGDRISLSKTLQLHQYNLQTFNSTQSSVQADPVPQITMNDIPSSPPKEQTRMQTRLYEMIISTPKILVDDQTPQIESPKQVYSNLKLNNLNLEKIVEHPEEQVSRKTSTTVKPHVSPQITPLNLSTYNPSVTTSSVLLRPQITHCVPQQRQPLHHPIYNPVVFSRSPSIMRLPQRSHSPVVRFAPMPTYSPQMMRPVHQQWDQSRVPFYPHWANQMQRIR